MTLPTFTLRQMIEAGVHFGHHARRWNPQMAPYIYGNIDIVVIIDLRISFPLLFSALASGRVVAAIGGRVLFVGSKLSLARRYAHQLENRSQIHFPSGKAQ